MQITEEETYQQFLMEDKCFEILEDIGYVGNPMTAKIEDRMELVR